MKAKFKEYKELNLPQINKDVLKIWDKNDTFRKSLSIRKGHPAFVFYEGPPSANGMPGIHHVMARAIKDIFCRYKTQQGFQVFRKAGWDTHGLPVELGVEKLLGITKEDIGKSISVEEYNQTCRREVMKYTDMWEDLTHKMGYWVNMEDPYITYDNRYIETLWYLLKELHKKGLLYKGKSIQPFSPAAGTGLSTHELNQPGCYRDVKDTTAVAQFKVVRNQQSESFFSDIDTDLFLLAWTTTPWTLPSNTALAVGPKISYVKISTYNPYTGQPITVMLAKDLQNSHFAPENAELPFEDYKLGDKKIPFRVLSEHKGADLTGIQYHQLFQFVKPEGDAFRVIGGDFVTTEDGTGIVHIAPTFGADDDRVAKAAGISPLILRNKQLNPEPMVDRTGKFYNIDELDDNFVKNNVNIEQYKKYAGCFVKNEYNPNPPTDGSSLDIDLCVQLKKEGLAFKIEKHTHNYPHCWRTDKPILYYPLDSWFIKTTALKERMMELNKTINWKPASTGTGRFGKWLENLVDWNLSRSRYWGTPLPIWVTKDRKELVCIGSVEELKTECEKSVKAGFMKENPLENFEPNNFTPDNYAKFDLHRPFVDNIVLVSESGKKMVRELDLIDVWFDSGAMPYAQIHYPFENKKSLEVEFPADFIAEGVDQTRGWFFTLHAIATMLFDSVAFKNIISNGLVLDKQGNKMSKRLGNAVDPFETIEKYGSDPLRWYMITNAQPWDNLKFDAEGVDEVKRKFFGTLYNTYSFFALYANVDGFTYSEPEIPVDQRQEIDRWVISLLNSLILEVQDAYDSYEPTRAGRVIQDFVTENLSNWYVRLNRKRFWGGGYNTDKVAAYQTLYTCLNTVAMLAAPIAPFFADQLFTDLNSITAQVDAESVHLSLFPKANKELIDKDLEERMDIAQKLSSMVLSLRRKVSIKVRQPLSKMMVPVLNEKFRKQLQGVQDLILAEVNVKELEYLDDSTGILVKKVKPNFKTLGPRFGKFMKEVSGIITGMSQEDISQIERENSLEITVNNEPQAITLQDVEIVSEDIPGWLVANDDNLTVALDITLTSNLKEEGVSRELVNRIQNIRKDSGFDVTDKVKISILKHDLLTQAIENHKEYIASQTLASEILLVDSMTEESASKIDLDTDLFTSIKVEKIDA
ncbi:MAG: isoleucine--tRNA ligase [Bacteroidales bacterium]|nr:isoleucine--tRNA ligase [Bacteroidales bacterium]MDD4673573.1 isoleucine--tRNA ligase [Bacteroidales bacterium]MDY0347819.1 isoleucine--tRNA ligase [Tenuifilaceae bacterium]